MATREPGVNYWVYQVLPEVYQMHDAIHDLETDMWDMCKSNVRTDDLMVFWMCMEGRERKRGVVAFGRVTSDPEWRVLPEHILLYMTTPELREERARVPLRFADVDYLLPPRLPLYDGDLGSELFRELRNYKVKRGQPGSLFHCSESLFDRLWTACGGEPFPRSLAPVQVARPSRAVVPRKTPTDDKVALAHKALKDAEKRRAPEQVMQMYQQAYHRALERTP